MATLPILVDAAIRGALMMAIAFLPKVSALLQSIPDVVVGSYLLVLLVLLFAQGLRLATSEGLSYEDGFVVCLSFWLGMAFQNQLVFPDHLPEWAHTLLDNGMTSGTLVAVLLTSVLAIKNRTRDRITLEPSTAAVPELHNFLARLAAKLGWDKGATDRLQLAGEEALLFLLGKEEEASRATPTSNRDHMPNVTGVPTPSAYEELVQLIRELMPEVRRIGTLTIPADADVLIPEVWPVRDEGLH